MNALLLLFTAAHGSQWHHIPALSQSVTEARAVVIGTITEAETTDAAWGLSTRYVIEVDEILAGQPDPYESLALPGGRRDGLVQRFSGIPLWEIGDTVLVLLPEVGQRQPLTGLFTVMGNDLIDPIGSTLRPEPISTVSDVAHRLRALP